MSKETLSPEAACVLLEMFAKPSRCNVVMGLTRPELEELGLIEQAGPQQGEFPEHGLTEKGACLCRAMIRVPLPIPTWVVPSLTRETDEGGPA